MEWKSLNNFERKLSQDHSCVVGEIQPTGLGDLI